MYSDAEWIMVLDYNRGYHSRRERVEDDQQVDYNSTG